MARNATIVTGTIIEELPGNYYRIDISGRTVEAYYSAFLERNLGKRNIGDIVNVRLYSLKHGKIIWSAKS